MNFDHYESPIDAYIDGQMTPEERQAFEQQIAADPALQSAIDLQQQIDASLLRNFTPPTIKPAVEEQAKVIRVWWNKPEFLALAASLMVAAVGLWRWTTYDLKTPDGYWRENPYTITSVHRYEVDNGFRPRWKCENEQQFAGSVWKQVGQPLVLGVLPSGSEALGLHYAKLAGSPARAKRGMHLMARVDGKNVLVFMEKGKQGQSIGTLETVRTGLRAFSRTIGDVTLTEVTPLQQPRVLEHFKPIEADTAWLQEGVDQVSQ